MFRRENPLLLLALMLSCGLLGAAAVVLTRLSGGIALLWVANAPLLAVLLARRPKHWGWPLAAAVAGEMIAAPFVVRIPSISAPLILVSIGEAVIAAALMRYWRVADAPLAGGRAVARFVAAAGILAPGIAGVAGALLVAPRVWHGFGHIWFDWLVGHGLGALIATPVVLLLLDPRAVLAKFGSPMRAVEAAALMALVAATTFLVFDADHLPLLFATTVPVLIATMRFDRLGATVSVALVAAIGGAMTLAGHGPMMLIEGGAGSRLQFFQLFLAVQFLLALPIAAVLSDRAALLRALAASEARYRLLADHATDAMLTLEPDGTIRFASAAVRDLAGLDPAALAGRNALSLVADADRERVRATHHLALASPEQSFTIEYRIRAADGRESWFETNTRAVLGDEGEIAAVVSVVRAIGARKAREAELQRQATTDPLTGLLNRGAIRARIDSAAASGRPAMLALLDLDHFKRINDTSGHAAGDAVLLGFADLLLDNVRPGDAVGRIGGEEFVILIQGAGPTQARAACERIRTALAAAPLAMGAEGPIFVTASIGLAPLGGNSNEAFRIADAALYRAKDSGRDRIETAEALAISV